MALVASVIDQAVAEAGDATAPAEGFAGGDAAEAEYVAASAAAGTYGPSGSGSSRRGAGIAASTSTLVGVLPPGGDVERVADAEAALLAVDRARLVSDYAGQQLKDAFDAFGERVAAIRRQASTPDDTSAAVPPPGLTVVARTASERSQLAAARLQLRQRLRDASTGGLLGAEEAAWGTSEGWSPGVPTSAHGLSAAVFLSVGWQSVGHAPSDHAVYSLVRAWVEAEEDMRDAMDAHGSEWAGTGLGLRHEFGGSEAPATLAFEDDAGIEGGAWAEFDVEDDNTSIGSDEIAAMAAGVGMVYADVEGGIDGIEYVAESGNSGGSRWTDRDHGTDSHSGRIRDPMEVTGTSTGSYTGTDEGRTANRTMGDGMDTDRQPRRAPSADMDKGSPSIRSHNPPIDDSPVARER